MFCGLSASASACRASGTAGISDTKQLRAELLVLKPRALQKRAEEMGVDEDDLDEAEDAAAIVALVVRKVLEERAAAEAEAAGAGLQLSAEEVEAIGFFLLSKRESGELVEDPAALPPLDAGLADVYAIHGALSHGP